MTHKPKRLRLPLWLLLLGALFSFLLASSQLLELGSDPGTAPETHATRGQQNGDAAAPGAVLHEQIEQLQALGYVGEADSDLAQTRVVFHEGDRAEPGVSLYNPAHAAEAYLIDMEGRVLQRWALPLEQAFAEGPSPSDRNRYWRRVRLLPDGDLLAIYEGVGLIRIDKDSNLLWGRANGAHHDFDLTAAGELVVLTRKAHVNPEIHPSEAVLEDFVEFVDVETGQLLREFSIYTAFADSQHAAALRSRKASGDILHTNTLQVLDGRHAGRAAAFAKGNLLISPREVSVIAIIDVETQRVVWSMAGQLALQHEPQLLANGHILLFDNLRHGQFSKVIEFDPLTQETHWVFQGNEENEFFSETMGSQQRLANGNTLITESNAGRVREVPATGEEVWRFHSPHQSPPEDAQGSGRSVRICEMQRFSEPMPAFVKAALLRARAPGDRSELARAEEIQPTAD